MLREVGGVWEHTKNPERKSKRRPGPSAGHVSWLILVLGPCGPVDRSPPRPPETRPGPAARPGLLRPPALSALRPSPPRRPLHGGNRLPLRALREGRAHLPCSHRWTALLPSRGPTLPARPPDPAARSAPGPHPVRARRPNPHSQPHGGPLGAPALIRPCVQGERVVSREGWRSRDPGAKQRLGDQQAREGDPGLGSGPGRLWCFAETSAPFCFSAFFYLDLSFLPDLQVLDWGIIHPGGSVVKNQPANAGDFSWVRKINGNPLHFLAWEMPRQRSLVGYSLWGSQKSWTRLSN